MLLCCWLSLRWYFHPTRNETNNVWDNSDVESYEFHAAMDNVEQGGICDAKADDNK